MSKLRLLILLVVVMLFAVPVLAQDNPTVGLSTTDEMGSFLVGPNGMTLYIFTPDPLDSSVCYAQCAANWPPLLVDSADAVTVADGIPGEVGTIVRTDNTIQVTYNGLPLYYWVRDAAPGDTKGEGVGNVWWIVPPATVASFHDPELGSILVGPTGLTVYTFTKDEMGVSNCYDQCATNWPPLLVDSADAVVAGENLLGEFGTTERTDGTIQVTYNGWPLYYWKDDAVRGDASGEGVGDSWYTVVPETVGLSSTDDLGQFLVSWNGKTLYTFTNDEAGVSNCNDDCANNWPPFTVGETDRLAAGAGIEGELGTITRADGSIQVTYNGMPLYYWKDDHAPGDVTGQGVGDKWFVAAP